MKRNRLSLTRAWGAWVRKQLKSLQLTGYSVRDPLWDTTPGAMILFETPDGVRVRMELPAIPPELRSHPISCVIAAEEKSST